MMKVESPYRYRLPGRVLLEKGVSEIGEMPAPAKEHLDKLIAAGVVKVLSAPPSKSSPPPKTETKPTVVYVAQRPPTAEVRRTADETPKADESGEAVDVSTRRRTKKE